MKTFWNMNNKAKFEPLEENLEADVCIIGGGITGIFNGNVCSGTV